MSLLAQTKPARSSEHFVFSTNSKWSTEQVTYSDKLYKIKVTKKCKDETEAPGECYWIVDFQSGDMPKMRSMDEPTGFTVEDINMDGTDEIVVLCAGHGAWVRIHVFAWGDPSQTSGPFWYEPIGAYEWYSGFEGDRVCDAQMFWMDNQNSVKILSTNPAETDFKCNLQQIIPWLVK